MKRTHIGNSGLWLGAMTMLFGSVVAVQAASSSTASSSVSSTHVSSAKSVDRSQTAAQLLRGIGADDAAVLSAAAHLDTLTGSSGARWLDYDRQWNEIMPSVEDMQIKLARLEKLQSELSPAQRAEVDQSKPLIGEIRSGTDRFLTLLDTPGVQTGDTRFKAYARQITNEAGKIEKLAPAK